MTSKMIFSDEIFFRFDKVYCKHEVYKYVPEGMNKPVYEVHEVDFGMPGSTILGIVNSENAAMDILTRAKTRILASSEYRAARRANA